MSKSRIKKVLVPVDGSECSRAAFEFACELAAEVGASIDALSVVESGAQPKNGAARSHGDDERSAARAELHRLVEGVPHDGQAVLEHVDYGNPTECILAAVERSRFDLIVMGTHGRTGRPRSLAGSVAESVVRMAPCPVLTVRE